MKRLMLKNPINNKELSNRNWFEWLNENLTFPFIVERIDDDDGSLFPIASDDKPFGIGQTMKVIGIEMEDDLYGMIMKVREGRHTAHLPLVELEVQNKNSKNFKLIDEYLEEWFSTQS